jgi:hypothetical protein
LIILFFQKKFQSREDDELRKILEDCYLESLRPTLYLKFNSKI